MTLWRRTQLMAAALTIYMSVAIFDSTWIAVGFATTLQDVEAAGGSQRQNMPKNATENGPPEKKSGIAWLNQAKQANHTFSAIASDSEVHSVAFSPDGRFVCVGERNVKRDRSVRAQISTFQYEATKHKSAVSRLIDLKLGREVRRLSGHDGATYVVNASFSSNSQYVVTTGFDSNASMRGVGINHRDKMEAIVWDVATGEKLAVVEGAHYAVINSDSRYLVTIGDTKSHGKAITVYDLTAIESQESLPVLWRKSGRFQYMAPIATDTRIFIPSSDGKTGVQGLDIKSGQVVSSFPLIYSQVSNMALDKTGTKLIAGGNQTVVWDLIKGNQIRKFGVDAKYVRFDDAGENVLTVDRNGRLQKWNIRNGNVVFETGGLSGALDFSPNAEFVAHSKSQNSDSNNQLYFTKIANGKKVLRYTPSDQPREFFLEAFDGTVAHYGFDAFTGKPNSPDAVGKAIATLDFSRSSNAKVESGLGKGRLFVLTIGVSKHQFPEYNLNFADRDADSIDEFFESQNGHRFQVYRQKYTNREASKTNILQGLQWLNESCGEDDVAIVLFAGHGIRGRNGLYFFPHEGDDEGIQHSCVNWTEIASLIAKNKSKKILFLADCCHAGSFAEKHRVAQKDIVSIFKQKEGLTLFCASNGNQKAFESGGHGYFTLATLKAVKGEADSDNDGFVRLSELTEFVTRYVSQRTGDQQTPYLPFGKSGDPKMVISVTTP